MKAMHDDIATRAVDALVVMFNHPGPLKQLVPSMSMFLNNPEKRQKLSKSFALHDFPKK